ncbi:MAG: hypothetical protein ABI992_02870 [Chthoniobacterales bacterium]
MLKFPFRILFAFSLLCLAACGQDRVVLLEPKDSDLVVLNGCVISACNYLAITKARHTLEPDYWAKVLLVRFDNHAAGHAYCVWETDGTIYGYDRNSGGFPIPVYTRDPRAIAIVLAGQLSQYLHENLSVQSADFVEPNQAKLYAFGAIPSERPTAPALLSTAPFSSTSALTLRPPAAANER